VLDSDFTTAGITTSGSGASASITMVDDTRFYLVNQAQSGYYVLSDMLNQEFSFVVNTANVACGGNGALYFTDMPTTGFSTASGYCDAQSGCTEMDVWEANEYATALTAHACENGDCDTGGCQVNPYKIDEEFYGPSTSDIINSAESFQVVTQFIATSGSLSEIKRFYIQNGKQSPSYNINTTYCSGSPYGGLTTVGAALNSGVVVVFSFWWSDGGMTWLDESPNGPCTTENFASGSVTFGSLKIGPIGSTYSSGSSSTSSTSAAAAATSTSTSTSSASTTGSVIDVFENEFENGYQSWSWGTYSTSTTCPSGLSGATVCLSLTLTNYGALYFHATSYFTLGTYTLTFSVYSTAVLNSGTSSIQFLLYNTASSPVAEGNDVGLPSTIQANTWTTVTIAFSSFGLSSSTEASGFAIQAVSTSGSVIYISDVVI
jgi:cellulase